MKAEAPFYIEQTLFINQKIEKIINSIIDRTDNNYIIVIQSDHGVPRGVKKLEERYPVLNAFYFPDKDYSLLYNEISLVNTWRIILNKYFNQNFDLLPDKAFWSYYAYPYNFEPFYKY